LPSCPASASHHWVASNSGGLSLDELHRAREVLQQAKLDLREAEERFDRECRFGVHNLPLINQISVAEKCVDVAREKLRKIDPGTIE
jgi:hypothetical protein